MGLRALVADDHVLFREGLRAWLENALGAEHVAQAGSLDEALDVLSAADQPLDLLILDLQMPGMAGGESCGAMREAFPATKVVVMSASEDRADILSALSAGAHGYLPKSLPAVEIEKALEEVLRGGIYAPAALGARAAEPAPPPARPVVVEGLTGRQRDVLAELLKGLSSKMIARNLHIAEGTVKIHLAAIYRTVGVRTRAEAIAKLSGAR